ncbi:PAS domain-containing protein [Pseudalkalibacillus hwajinpoensis]|uniref:PAS domain-containing protein n=1 Tax=Guptibacillus hwajinpoensis TaxID=208199 RepID=UPI00325A8BD0
MDARKFTKLTPLTEMVILFIFKIKTIPIKIDGAFRGAYKIIKDISDYKKSQLETLEQAAQLQSLIDSIPEFVVFKDGNGRIIEMNEYAKSIFKIGDKQYVGKTCEQLNCYHNGTNQLLLNSAKTDQVAWEMKSKIEYEHKIKRRMVRK